MKHCFCNWTNLRHFFVKKISAKGGFSLVETLIAAAIILTNLGVISSAVVQYGEVSRKQRIITSAMDIEAAIHGAVSNPGNYSGAIIDSMITTYRFPDPFTLTIAVENTSGPISALMTNAAPTFSTFLNEKLNPCGGNFTNNACVIQVEVSRAPLTSATPDAPSFAFAYRVRINPNINIKVLNLGVNHDDPFADPAAVIPPPVNATTGKRDYNVYVPQFLLLADTQSDCVAGTVGMTGFDKNTGLAQCLRRPLGTDACPAGEFAKGLVTVLDAGPFKMKLICIPTLQFRCGAPIDDASFMDYSMHRFDPGSLDSEYTPALANQCILTTEDASTAAVPFVSAANLGSMTVTNPCPPRYNLASDCTLDTVTTPLGQCVYCPGGAANRDGYGTCLSAPATFNWTSAAFTPVGSSITLGAFSPGTDTITCYAPTDNTDLSGITECNPPYLEPAGITRPARKATFRFTAVCSREGATQQKIPAVAF